MKRRRNIAKPTSSPSPPLSSSPKITLTENPSAVMTSNDVPLTNIQISGPTLASLIQRVSFSLSDVDGLLFGHVTSLTPTNLSDDDTIMTSSQPSLIATVTSFYCSSSTSSFSSPSGHLSTASLRRLIPTDSTTSLIGWFSGRRKTKLRPSMRESNLTACLAKIQTPCLFILLTTPFNDQLIHTHEYKAYQYRNLSNSFEGITLDVVNLGPAFRGHYGNFVPNNSTFPALTVNVRGLSGGGGDLMVVEEEEKKGDDGFGEVQRLERLVGANASNYTGELEDLYESMLAKLDGLARLVEKSSARVLEQVRVLEFTRLLIVLGLGICLYIL